MMGWASKFRFHTSCGDDDLASVRYKHSRLFRPHADSAIMAARFGVVRKNSRMAHPKDRIQEDLKAAMKAGDAAKRDALRMLSSAFKQEEIDKQITLTEEQAIAVLMKEASKRRDTISEMVKAGRTENVGKEQEELALIETYLPKQMTREEIEVEVRAAMAEAGATSAKDMGALMKVLMPRTKGRADGKLVNDVVKALLNG